MVHLVSQDLSIAGKRQGLAGERSGLFMEAIRIIKEMRERGRADGRANEFGDVFPRFAIWENVAGAFSSNRGEDFRCVLEEFCNIKGKDIIIPQPKNGKWDKAGIIIGDGFSVAWRLFDAQYWGVPQRRKRIAVVGDFTGWSAGEILFEREGVRGDIAKSEQERQGTSRSVGESSNGTDRAFTLKIRGGADTYIKSDGSVGTAGKGPLIQDNLSGTLGVSQDQTLFCSNEEIKDFVRDNNKNIEHQQDMLYTEEDKCGSLAAGTHGSAGHLHNIIIPMQDDGTTSMTKHGPGWHEEDVGYTVNTVDRQSVAYGIDQQGGKGNANYESDICPTLCSDSHGTPHGVAYGIEPQSVKEEPILLESNQNHATIQTNGISTTLPASMGMGGGYVPMVCDKTVNETTSDIQGFDGYNQQSTGNITMPLRSKNADSDHIPIAYGIGRDAFNMGENAKFGMSVEENTQPPITAKGAGGVCSRR